MDKQTLPPKDEPRRLCPYCGDEGVDPMTDELCNNCGGFAPA